MLFFVLLTFIFFQVFAPLAQAQNFQHRFILRDNSINLNFTESKISPAPLPTVSASPTNTAKELPKPTILSFIYELKSDKPLIPNLPLVILSIGKQVLFYLTASQLNLPAKQVRLDLSQYVELEQQSLPVFFRNQSLGDFTFRVSELEWLESLPAEQASLFQIKNLSLIRERDQALTIIFEVVSELALQNSYQLVCQNNSVEPTNSTMLLKKDDFLWPDFVFQSFRPNHKHELIFQLKDFNCQGPAYVEDKFKNRSEAVGIVAIQEL